MNYYLQTFGCKSNQYESQGIREAMNAAGHAECDGPGGADLYIINTCGVTGRAGASCRNAIRKALRANSRLRVVVTGCGVDLDERWPDAPATPFLLVPNARKHTIPALLAATAEVPGSCGDRFGLSISRFHGHTRAFIKVQDGCDNFCSYCAVPFARGAPESRPRREILDEARRLVDGGHAELVLTGINIGAYRHGGADLASLAASLATTPGLARLRLGSVEPPYLTEELVDAMAQNSAICPHVHLPLQSGDDGVLAAMGRRYSVADFLEKVAMLKERLHLPSITTDVIVGFPGENAAAAAASVETCRRAGLSRLHVFLFSARPGTRAAAMRRTATDREVEERKSRLIETGGELSLDYASACVGMTERIIVEKSGGGLSDRYIKVNLEEDKGTPGQVLPIVITGAGDDGLVGRPCRD